MKSKVQQLEKGKKEMKLALQHLENGGKEMKTALKSCKRRIQVIETRKFIYTMYSKYYRNVKQNCICFFHKLSVFGPCGLSKLSDTYNLLFRAVYKCIYINSYRHLICFIDTKIKTCR